MSKLERFGIGFCAIAAVALVAAMYWPKEKPDVYMPVPVTEPSPITDVVFGVKYALQEVAAGDEVSLACWDSVTLETLVSTGWYTLDGTETEASIQVDAAGHTGSVEVTFQHRPGPGLDLKGSQWSLFQLPAWIKYGTSRENALAWDDPAKHRFYRNGGPLQGQPAGWDFSDDPHGVKSDLPANIVFGGLTVPFNTGDYVARIYLTSPGADILWMEMDLEGQTEGASWTATVTMDGREGLPRVISDNWATWLGSKRKEQTLRVDLVKAADGSVIASDAATWTMTVKQPEVGITAGLVSLDLAGGHSYRM